MYPWQLIIDPPQDGAANMATDASLLDEVEASLSPLTVVRFYQWRRLTLSLGRNQRMADAVDMDYCAARGIDIVHRPTGGRAVLHADELTYAVASNDVECFGDQIYANYKRVSEALCDAYCSLGVPAILAPETRKLHGSPSAVDLPCFLSPSRYELTVDGRKVVGSAQRRVKRSFLQHGSMPMTCDREMLARATRMEDASLLYREMAGLAEFLTERPSISDFTDALTAAFQNRFGVEFTLRKLASLV